MQSLLGACVLAAGILVSCAPGNGSREGISTAGGSEDAVIIAKKDLPPGWSLLPQAQMPPNDKVPWWQTNPQTLDAPLPAEFMLVRNRPSAASRVRAAIYGKEGERAVVFWVRYPTVDAMGIEFDIVGGQMSAEDGLLGVDREDAKAYVLMHVPQDAQDREFFVKRFRALTSAKRVSRPSTQRAR
jgi:hypothetical protein